MSQKIPLLTLSIAATAAITAERFVTLAGAPAAAAGNAVGVAASDGAIGALVPVDVAGTTVVVAAGAIAVGDAVQVGTGGKAQTNQPMVATQALDFPSIAPQSSAEMSISVPGAQVGQLTILGLPAAPPAGLAWDAYVSAADTVKVRASNTTIAAIDPPSATYSVQVFGGVKVGRALQAAAADGDRIEVLLFPN